jgi:hypothetical protein
VTKSAIASLVAVRLRAELQANGLSDAPAEFGGEDVFVRALASSLADVEQRIASTIGAGFGRA